MSDMHYVQPLIHFDTVESGHQWTETYGNKTSIVKTSSQWHSTGTDW